MDGFNRKALTFYGYHMSIVVPVPRLGITYLRLALNLAKYALFNLIVFRYKVFVN